MTDESYWHLESESAIPGRSTIDLGSNYGSCEQLNQVTEISSSPEVPEDGSSPSVRTQDQHKIERDSWLGDLKNFKSTHCLLKDDSTFPPTLKLSKERRLSAPVVPKISEETLYPDFLLGKQYPSASKFDKKIRSNPYMDLVLCRKASSVSSFSSTKSLQLTQLQYNIYLSNVEGILKEVLQTWFEKFNDTVVSLIMEYLSNAKCVSFSPGAPKYYIVDPMGSEHRGSEHRGSEHRMALQRSARLDVWNRKLEFSPAEKEEAKETFAGIDFLVEFPDAYQ